MEVGEGAGWVCGVPTGERGKNEKMEERKEDSGSHLLCGHVGT